jgi:cephalosporin hydroxylase
VPLAGGCVFIHNAANAVIQDSSFSNCASSAVGGSVAMIFVTAALILRSTFSDSLVHVVNSSFLSQPVDRIVFQRTLAQIQGQIKLPGGIGYGGAVLIIASYSSGVSLSVSGCTFVRCQVLALSDDYDFFNSFNSNRSGIFLQGGAVAAFLPIVNKSSAADPGYVLTVSKSTFTQCILFCSSMLLPTVNFDVAVGGAISVFDSIPTDPFPENVRVDRSFVIPPSRVVLQDITLSGTFVTELLVMVHPNPKPSPVTELLIVRP